MTTGPSSPPPPYDWAEDEEIEWGASSWVTVPFQLCEGCQGEGWKAADDGTGELVCVPCACNPEGL